MPQSIEHPGPLGDEEELGSGDGVGSAEEVDFHVRILPSCRVGRATLARAAATRRWSGRDAAVVRLRNGGVSWRDGRWSGRDAAVVRPGPGRVYWIEASRGAVRTGVSHGSR